MFKNNFAIALRNFKKRKAFTFINTLGLTVGMTVCLLILTYTRYEKSYDRFHSNVDDIYRVAVHMYNGNELQVEDAQCYPGAGLLAKEEMSEIEDYAMARNFGRFLFKTENVAFNEDRSYFVNPGWLKIFDWEFVQGDPETALNDINMLVLTESTARKYFGDEDPMGKKLTVVPGGGQLDMVVNGVIKDVPANAHLHFDILISYESAVKHIGSRYDDFNGNNEFMYLLANQPLDQDFEKRYNELYFSRTNSFEERGDSLSLMPMSEIHLYSDKTYEAEANGSYQVVNILIIVAVFVLLIAWVNYINLSTARALERAKEVGVRKVMGSSRSALVIQFLTESLILNFLAMVLTLTCIQGVLPFFNNLADVQLSFSLFDGSGLIWQVLLIYVVGSIISGLYPAFILSNYKPLAVISGNLKDSKSGLILRKSLVVFQFMITMLLLVGTITIYQQVNYMRSQDLGINIDRTIGINAPLLADSREQAATKRKTLKSELLRLPEIQSVAYSASMFGRGTLDLSTTTGMQAAETEIGKNVNFSYFDTDDQFMQTFDFRLLSGRFFNASLETPFEKDYPVTQGMILNETARKAFGFESNEEAIGKKINRWGMLFTVVGVIADYNHNSLKTQVDPMTFFYDKAGVNTTYMAIKVNIQEGSYKGMISKVEEIYRGVYPESDFDYFFVDEDFQKQYAADQRFGSVFTTFAFITIFVAILGLFGLVLYEVQQRIKEIGIRKVLGASVSSIIRLLSTNFLKLIMISIIIALPIAYFGMNEWLSGYAYRIELGLLIFVLPAIVLLLLALLTIAAQSVKAASENPVKSLRYE